MWNISRLLRPTWWSWQVDLQWNLSKHPHLDETIAEVGNMKISVADFKTIIHYPISDEEEQILKSYHKMRKFNPWWLNDKVTRIKYVTVHNWLPSRKSIDGPFLIHTCILAIIQKCSTALNFLWLRLIPSCDSVCLSDPQVGFGPGSLVFLGNGT